MFALFQLGSFPGLQGEGFLVFLDLLSWDYNNKGLTSIGIEGF